MIKIAIPSYKRPNVLKNKTLKVLLEQKIDPKRIIIFVSDKEQKKEYLKILDPNTYDKIVIGVSGIKNIRNFMANYFKENQKIFYIDDDISQIFQVFNDETKKNFSRSIGKVIPKLERGYNRSHNKLHYMRNLGEFIDNAFKTAEEKGCTNWGIYPVENPYFMKPTTEDVNDYTSTKLSYIMGGFTGVVNNKKAEIRTIDDKEDYERTIKYYLKDGGVLRFLNVCVRTRCYTEPGGMQENRTKERIHESAVYLTKQYPLLCTLNTSKKSGFSEVKLRDRRFSKDKKFKVNCSSVLKKNNKSKKTKKMVKIKIKDMKIPKCSKLEL